jgi:hypothetical protein
VKSHLSYWPHLSLYVWNPNINGISWKLTLRAISIWYSWTSSSDLSSSVNYFLRTISFEITSLSNHQLFFSYTVIWDSVLKAPVRYILCYYYILLHEGILSYSKQNLDSIGTFRNIFDKDLFLLQMQSDTMAVVLSIKNKDVFVE